MYVTCTAWKIFRVGDGVRLADLILKVVGNIFKIGKRHHHFKIGEHHCKNTNRYFKIRKSHFKIGTYFLKIGRHHFWSPSS